MPDLKLALIQIPDQPITRFAPSPTGYLHLGHIANAIFTWGLAKAKNGKVILRIEDHDISRTRAEYVKAIREDLFDLGFEVDEVVPLQTQRRSAYENYAQQPSIRERLFRCQCSRKNILEHPLNQKESRNEIYYPGTCRTLDLKDAGNSLRFRMESKKIEFLDLRLGPQVQNPHHQCGDLLIRDRHGQWTYQYCVCVDDLDQGVNLVVRGEDLLESTGRQIYLKKWLKPEGQKQVYYYHHALLKNEKGEKLSKRFLSTSVRELMRKEKWSVEKTVGLVLYLIGLHPTPSPVSNKAVLTLFNQHL